MSEETSVRIATPDDRTGLVTLLRMMHAENGTATLSDDKMFAMLDRGLRRERGIVGVVENNGKIVASVGLFTGTWWYSDDFLIEDFWNFVHPEHRQSSYAKELISFGKRFSENLGIPLIMGVLSTDRTEAKVRLYGRQIPFAGAIFLYGAKTAGAGVHNVRK